MLVFFGTRPYGKVDEVPGLFHVATMFFYVQFIPVLPTRSVLVMADQHPQARGKMFTVRLSLKSIVMAWLRLALLAGSAGCLIAVAVLEDRDKHWIPYLIGSSLLCGIAFFLSYRFTRARPERALQLAAHIGIPPETVASYFANRLTDKDLEEMAEKARVAQEPAVDQYTSDS